MESLLKKLSEVGLEGPEAEYFLSLYKKFQQGPAKVAEWESIQSPHASEMLSWDNLPSPDSAQLENYLSRLVVCKLNGGLGTSMGCSGPKSLIVVKEGKTFLDLMVDQLVAANRKYNTKIPLVLMNSFYTQAETARALESYSGLLSIEAFEQSRFPRIQKTDGSLLDEKEFGREAWYPPGHGDFYHCIANRGLLDNWLRQGRDILFLSNSDNLGAVWDEKILTYMIEHDVPFLMELTPKTLADVKGGTIYNEGDRLRLLEIAQVPEERVDEFCNVEKFSTFSTNNIWINLRSLAKKLERGALGLELIVNNKTVGGVDVVQLETAIGAAIEFFPGAVGLLVPRERFRPVKRTSDLFLVQSNLFELDEGRMRINSQRTIKELPNVNFGAPFDRLDGYNSRFKSIPDIINLESLTLEGDITFEGSAVLEGKVTLGANEGSRTIGQGELLKNTSWL